MRNIINPAVLVSLSGSGDVIAPTVIITLSSYSFAIGDTATVTFTFSEEPTGFTVSNITAQNGTLSSFTVTANPLIYTATFTPTNGVSDATNVISVDVNWTDAAGNHPESVSSSDNYTVNTTYTISGTVYDADGTTAVASATVALGALTATSGADGTYTISGILPGASGSMTCTKTGYSWTPITVSAMSGNLTSQNYTNTWYAVGGTSASIKLAYKAIGAASLAASKVNLSNPGTNDLTLPGGQANPTFNTATGWTHDGATTVLDSGFVPPNQAARTILVRIANATVGVGVGRVVCSSRNGAPQLKIGVNDGGNKASFANGSTGYTHTTTIASGVLVVAGQKAYLNGSEIGSFAAGTYDQGTTTMAIGCLNNGGGSFAQFYLGDILAFAEWDATLDATQVAIVSAAVANFT